jgi:hypothetical protein
MGLQNGRGKGRVLWIARRGLVLEAPADEAGLWDFQELSFDRGLRSKECIV